MRIIYQVSVRHNVNWHMIIVVLSVYIPLKKWYPEEILFYLHPGNGRNINKGHSKSNFASSTMPTCHMNDDTR